MDQHQDWMADRPVEVVQMGIGADDMTLNRPRPPRGYAWPAWIVIILICAASVYLQNADVRVTSKARQGGEDRLDAILMELQGKLFVGEAAWQNSGAMVFEQVKKLNEGSVGQRQRFIILAAELAGAKTASQELHELEQLIEQELNQNRVTLYGSQGANQAILHKLYDQDPTDETERADTQPAEADRGVVHVERVTPAERDLLLKELGWYGKLALAPEGQSEKPARDAVIDPVIRLILIVFAAVVVLGVCAVAGFIGLILLLVMSLKGAVQGNFQPGLAHHGLYAETFAVWMSLFMLLQVAAGVVSYAAPNWSLVFVLMAFVGSLAALGWPVIRGVPWSAVRRDIGWMLGRQPALEPIVGIGGYCMALPLLATGVTITFLLILVQQHFAAERPPLAPSGNPAHPIIMELAGPDWWPKIMILFLAAVAAPIVEETMFRGVLYRHLRDATSFLGRAFSILLSGFINAFLFAVIHPQGWVAIPALMSLAFTFVILREWRGSLLPSMIVHGINNFLVMTLVILALRA